MGVEPCFKQYTSWLALGHTVTDFLSYLIALLSASAESSFEQICSSSEQLCGVESISGWKLAVNDRVNKTTGAESPDGANPQSLWATQSYRLAQAIQMTRSDMQHWTGRLMWSWLTALGGFGFAML